MRTDLSAGFLAATQKTASTPVLLLKIDWPALPGLPALSLRLADAAWTVGQDAWHALVLDWGVLMDPAFDARSAFADVTVWNGPVDLGGGPSRFSDGFQGRPPEAAVGTVYRWFGNEGLDESDLAPFFVARLSGPVVYDEGACTFRLRVLAETLGGLTIGGRIAPNGYPQAPEESMGRTKPIVVGTVSGVPGLRVRRVRRTRLVSVALPAATELQVASTEGFAGSGLLLVNDDTVVYTGKTADRFTGCSGIHEFHYADDEVLEKIGDHRFLFSDPAYPIQGISNVKVAGQPADPATYTADLAAGEVVFSKPPQQVRSVDTKFLQAQFDEVGSGNTALDPQYALQPNLRTKYARIHQAARLLQLKQTDVLPALGQIGRVLLRVEHFMEERLSADSVAVRLSSVGEVGTLSPPGADDAASTSGSTDITHNHLDTLGFPIDIPQPAITPSSQADHIVEQGATGTGRNLSLIAGSVSVPIYFPSAPAGALKAEYQVNLNVVSGLFGFGTAVLLLHGRTMALWNAARGNFDYTPSFTLTGGSQPASMTLSVGPNGGQWTVDLISVKRLLFYPHATQATQQSQQTVKTGGNVGVSETPALSAVTEKATRTVVDFFDVTPQVNGDWGWFTNRQAEVEYTGSGDGRTVFVLHVGFEIEYARRRLAATDEVTADVAGVIDDASGTVTGTPLALIERPDHAFLWSLKRCLGLADAALDSASFTAAGALFAGAVTGGYRLAGVIQNQQTWDAVWRQWMTSSRSRLLWNGAGQARLLFRPLNSSNGVQGQEVKTLSASEVLVAPATGRPRLRLSRDAGGSFYTRLDVPYARAWEASAAHYRKLAAVQNTVQAAVFGLLEKPGGLPLDWCAGDATAQDLAAFYLAEFAQPQTRLECDMLLEQVDLESGDIVKLDFAELGLANVFAEITGRADLPAAESAGGLDAVRLFARVFPIAVLLQNAAETAVLNETPLVEMLWQDTLLETAGALETVFVLDVPAPAQAAVNVGDLLRAGEFPVWGEPLGLLEAVAVADLPGTVFETARLTEAAFTNAPGGWGGQAWGLSGWGGWEILS